MGSFYGYRELLIPPTGGPSSVMPPLLMPWAASVQPWDLPSVPALPYDYRVFRGTASDDFAIEWTLIDEETDFVSIVMEANIKKSEVEIAITTDGVSVSSLFILNSHKMVIQKARGFVIRSLVPGDDCHYQLIFYK